MGLPSCFLISKLQRSTKCSNRSEPRCNAFFVIRFGAVNVEFHWKVTMNNRFHVETFECFWELIGLSNTSGRLTSITCFFSFGDQPFWAPLIRVLFSSDIRIFFRIVQVCHRVTWLVNFMWWGGWSWWIWNWWWLLKVLYYIHSLQATRVSTVSNATVSPRWLVTSTYHSTTPWGIWPSRFLFFVLRWQVSLTWIVSPT